MEKTYCKWYGNTPVLTYEDTGTSASYTPVYMNEIERFLFRTDIRNDSDCNIYLWAHNYIYYLNGKRICRTNCQGVTWYGCEGLTVDEIRKKVYGSPVNPQEFVEANAEIMKELEEETVEKVLRVSEEYESLPFYVCFSGGKDSEVLLDIVMKSLPVSRYSVVFNDTRQEFETTYKRVNDLAEILAGKGVNFIRIDSGIDPVEIWLKASPPTQNNRYCCKIYKYSPPGMHVSRRRPCKRKRC